MKPIYIIEGIKPSMKGCELVGQRFGRLVVISQAPSAGGSRRWNCQCDCGNTTVARTGDLRKGDTKSCGCIRKEVMCTRLNLSRHPIYTTWNSMIGRCYRPATNGYSNYGGRGITVCDEWKDDFMSFYDWSILNGWKEGLTIDRIDVNGNYEPSNCRWVTREVQAKNKRTNLYLTFDGRTQTVGDWAKEIGISSPAIRYRLKAGWSVEDALTVSKRSYSSKTFKEDKI